MSSSPTFSSAASIAESISSVTTPSPSSERASLKDFKNFIRSPSDQPFTNRNIESSEENKPSLNTNKNVNKISLELQKKLNQFISEYTSKQSYLNSSISQSVNQLTNRKDLFCLINQSLLTENKPITSETAKNEIFQEKFITDLFNSILEFDYEDQSINDTFEKIHIELTQSHVIKNVFLVIAKLGHEFFKFNLLSASECLLEFTISSIETPSLRLKMATLSTLSACYWRQSKFVDSINCMNLELRLATHLNSQLPLIEKPSDANKEIHLNNIYRIYGNLASAYQRLDRYAECLQNFEKQLEVSLQMKDDFLVVNANNSIGLVFNKLKRYEQSLESFERSLQLINATETEENISFTNSLKLIQYNLLGECCLKLNMYEKARDYFMEQLTLSSQLTNEYEECLTKINQGVAQTNIQLPVENFSAHIMQECLALFSLALISSKLKKTLESTEYYVTCLNKIKTHMDSSSYSQQTLEMTGRVFIGLINNYLSIKDNIKASLYAHAMLDFTLKEISKLKAETKNNTEDIIDNGNQKLLNKSFNSMNKSENDEEEEIKLGRKRRYQYLKFIEMTSCSKLATCYFRQNRLTDAFKLHQREASLAMQLNNTLYLTRAYSHMAQIYFHSKDYEKCIYLYKQILHTIEMSLLNTNSTNSDEINENYEINDFDYGLNGSPGQKSKLSVENHSQDQTENTPDKYSTIKDERLIQMIYFTLSNLGLCMEMLNRFDDSCLMFHEQLEISKLINNSKFKANALLNLVNLYLNKTKIDSTISILELSNSKQISLNSQFDTSEHLELVKMLRQLFDIYQELDDLNGKLFTSQCLAYCYHTNGNLPIAIKFYEFNIDLCKNSKSGTNEMLKKSLFNLSLCYKMQSNFEKAYDMQMEYFEQIDQEEITNEYAKFTSLGLIADFLFEMNKTEENCQNCIQIHIDRLKIIKSIDTSKLSENKTLSDDNKCKLISDCLESIARLYYETSDYQQVLKFKLLQIDLQSELKQSDEKAEKSSVNKLKAWLDIGNLYLFKLEDANEAYKYFEIVLEIAQNINDLLLQSLVLGNMGICKQKIGEYDESLEYFKEQLVVLQKKLKSIDESFILKTDKLETNQNTDNISNNYFLSNSSSSLSNKIDTDSLNKQDVAVLQPTFENINKIKEIISIRIDMGRAYSKLGKCNELLSHHKVQAQFYLNEALKYFNEYCRECEFLFENYVKTYFDQLKKTEQLQKSKSTSPNQNQMKNENLIVREDETDDLLGFEMKVHHIMKDLCEQIYIDYDVSFAKLANFYTLVDSKINNVSNLEKAIDINEKRLNMLSYFKPILNRSVWANFSVQINFLLANLFAKQVNTMNKCSLFCDNIIMLYTEEPLFENIEDLKQQTSKLFNGKFQFLKDNLYLIETLNLMCDVSLILKSNDLNYDLLLDKALKAYKMIWQRNGIDNTTNQNTSKFLKLKFDSICRLCCIYRKLKMPKECLEILMEGSSRFTQEFQQLQQKNDLITVEKDLNISKSPDMALNSESADDITHSTNQASVATSAETTNSMRIEKRTEQKIFLIQYVEYLFIINRKVALIHIKHAIESNLIAKNKELVEKSFFLALKYVNEALFFLNYQKEVQIGPQIIECRQASIYFLLGKCHKFLKNTEMELEMFANALDLYENIVPQNGYNAETLIKDRITSIQPKSFNDCTELFDSIKNDDDEETVVNYVERIDFLYQYIEDALIKMKKLKEALLVTERHRAKKSASLLNLPELLKFEQIEKLMESEQLHAIIYFSRVEISSKINCWLLMPNKGVQKFHQVNFKTFENIFASKNRLINNSSMSQISYSTQLQRKISDENSEINLFKSIYESLIQPFENNLFENLVNVNEQFLTKQSTKPAVSIVYEEEMFKIPFHFLKTSRTQKFFFEIFETDCIFSLKFLYKSVNYNQKFVKNQHTNDSVMPMRVISNEEDMEKLLTTSVKDNQYQYDLLLLLVDSENKDLRALNLLVITLLSKKLGKSVLLEFNSTNSDFEQKFDSNYELAKSEANSKNFLSKLYSKLSNRSLLKSSLVLNTLISEYGLSSQSKLYSYLIFGHLSKPFEKPEILSPKPKYSQIVQLQKIQNNSKHSNGQDIFNVETPILIKEKQDKLNLNRASILKRETSLENLLVELAQESEEVTFSQVIVQFLKLNSKFEQTSIILKIVVTILDDFLCNRLVRDTEDPGSVTLKNLFQSFSKIPLQNNQLVASRLMLKKLGFHFYIDSNARYLTRLPSKNFEKKLRLIYRCLLIFQTFPPKLLQGLFERTKHKSGKDFLSLLQKFHSKASEKNQNLTQFRVGNSTFEKHGEFLQEFSNVAHLKENVEVVCNTEMLNNLILIATIILNDDMKNEAERCLQDYIEVFFKNMDGEEIVRNKDRHKSTMSKDELIISDDEEDDPSSQYSTLSSMLGIQSPEKKNGSIKKSMNQKPERREYEIKIVHEQFQEPKLSKQEIVYPKRNNTQPQKTIEINVLPRAFSSNCEDYLNGIIQREQIQKNSQSTRSDSSEVVNKYFEKSYPLSLNIEKNSKNRTNNNNNIVYDPEEEFKCKSLVHLEEKECTDQFVTTTTTVRTRTKDDLFMLFDNNFFGNEHHSEEQLNEYFMNVNDKTKLNFKMNQTKGNINTNNYQHPKILNINKDVYSCLNNYFSDANFNEFSIV